VAGLVILRQTFVGRRHLVSSFLHPFHNKEGSFDAQFVFDGNLRAFECDVGGFHFDNSAAPPRSNDGGRSEQCDGQGNRFHSTLSEIEITVIDQGMHAEGLRLVIKAGWLLQPERQLVSHSRTV
jgi:hypothetical protein